MDKRQKILIVDDSKLNRDILKEILGDAYNYLEAENGNQAIRMIGENIGIDLMLLDINMPQMNGFEVLKIMKRSQCIAETPVIMISSEDAVDTMRKAYELGITDYNRVQFEAVRSEAGLNRFVMTPTKWIEQTNAIGIVSKAGRYGGGTYAHSDIAMAFATWISPEFQLYIMKDYRRLKQDENSRLSLDWNLNRALSKVNYRIHTDAVKENLIPPELTPEQIAYTYASEADLLNVALFGQTAKQWKNNNPGKKGNVRDDANLNQLLVLANMESYNAILIEQGKSQSERLILLRNLAIRQMDTLASINLSAVSALPGDDM